MREFKKYFTEGVAEKNSEKIYEKLSERQQDVAKALAVIVDADGKFDKGIDGNGAHYREPEDNIDHDKGLACGHCLFFDGKKLCSIVDGKIDHKAICKYWIIPEEETR